MIRKVALIVIVLMSLVFFIPELIQAQHINPKSSEPAIYKLEMQIENLIEKGDYNKAIQQLEKLYDRTEDQRYIFHASHCFDSSNDNLTQCDYLKVKIKEGFSFRPEALLFNGCDPETLEVIPSWPKKKK